MSRIITREQTKKLVRGLKKQLVGDREVFGIRSIVLYGDGDGRFKWLSEFEEKVPYGMTQIGVPATLAYEKDGAGNLRRKKLGELDDLFYHAINNSSFSKKKEAMKEFEAKVLDRENRKLKYATLMLLDLGDEFKLSATLYRIKSSPEIVNSHYRRSDGYDLGDGILDFMEAGDYDLKGIEEDSESGMMAISVGDKYTKYWEEFVRAVVDFDKELQRDI